MSLPKAPSSMPMVSNMMVVWCSHLGQHTFPASLTHSLIGVLLSQPHLTHSTALSHCPPHCPSIVTTCPPQVPFYPSTPLISRAFERDVSVRSDVAEPQWRPMAWIQNKFQTDSLEAETIIRPTLRAFSKITRKIQSTALTSAQLKLHRNCTRNH